MYKALKSKQSGGRRWKTGLVVIVMITLVVLGLEITNTTHWFHKPTAKSGSIPSTIQSSADVEESEKPSSEDEATENPPTTPSQNTEKVVTSPTSGTELLSPSGSFVNNHSPSFKNSPNMESVCITTPGAFCKITFTKDGVTKTLDEKKSDSTGTVIWSWNIDSAGFIEGSWTITATATLDGRSKSTTDLNNLEVKP